MQKFIIDGTEYQFSNDLPMIGDYFVLGSGKIVQAKSIAHLEVLVSTGAELIKPIK